MIVPDVAELKTEQATETLRAAGFVVTNATVPVNESIDAGKVRGQFPRATTAIAWGSTVRIDIGQWTGAHL